MLKFVYNYSSSKMSGVSGEGAQVCMCRINKAIALILIVYSKISTMICLGNNMTSILPDLLITQNPPDSPQLTVAIYV